MARPRAPDPRCKIVAVRFRPDEAMRLDQAAAAAGQTVSDFIRASVFGQKPTRAISAIHRHDLSQLTLALARGGDAPAILAQLRVILGKIGELVEG